MLQLSNNNTACGDGFVLLDICMLASLLPKTNIHFKCGTQCSNIQAGLCVLYLALIYARVRLSKEFTPSLVLVNLRVFMRRSEQM